MGIKKKNVFWRNSNWKIFKNFIFVNPFNKFIWPHGKNPHWILRRSIYLLLKTPMFFLSELWFLVSTAILEFMNWKRKRKKLRIPTTKLNQTLFWIKCASTIISLTLAVFSVFAIFSSSKGKFDMMPEIDSGVAGSTYFSIANSKAFCIACFAQFGCNEFLLSIKNVVSTKTEISGQRNNNKNILTSYSCSPGFLLNICYPSFSLIRSGSFLWSLVNRAIFPEVTHQFTLEVVYAQFLSILVINMWFLVGFHIRHNPFLASLH